MLSLLYKSFYRAFGVKQREDCSIVVTGNVRGGSGGNSEVSRVSIVVMQTTRRESSWLSRDERRFIGEITFNKSMGAFGDRVKIVKRCIIVVGSS